MKILITGGAGFIGSHLTRKLLNSGQTVFVVDNFITATGENLREFQKNPRFTFLKHDITKPFSQSLNSKLSSVDLLYHLACPTGVPNLIPLAEEMILACSLGTRNVLELARNIDAKVLFTSSSEVYGNPEKFPQKEEYTGNVNPVGIRSPYEEGKRFSESLVAMYVRKYKLDAKIVRIFNTYGPGMSPTETRVIWKFLSQAQRQEPLTVEGDGKQTRTFCFVDDLVDGLLLIMQKGKMGEVYNLGSDKEISMLDLAKQVIKLTGSKSSITFIKRPKHDHERRKPSLSKVQKLGWRPHVSLTEGIRKTIV